MTGLQKDMLVVILKSKLSIEIALKKIILTSEGGDSFNYQYSLGKINEIKRQLSFLEKEGEKDAHS